jgi:hypothetical protein
MFNNVFSENRAVYDVEMCGGGRQATNEHARCMLGKYGYTRGSTRPRPRTPAFMHARTSTRAHTHTQICNTYCFSTATMVTRTHLSVMQYVHCLSSLQLFHSLYMLKYRIIYKVKLWLSKSKTQIRVQEHCLAHS